MRLLSIKYRDKESVKEKNKKMYKMFFSRLLKHKLQLILIAVLMFFTSLLYVSIPFVLKEGIQKLYTIQSYHFILIAGVVLVVLYMLLSLLKEKQIVSFTFKFIADLKKELFKGILRKGLIIEIINDKDKQCITRNSYRIS